MVLFLLGCEAKIPEFAGIYVLNGREYQEVPRFKEFNVEEFNHIMRTGFMGGTDCNVKSSIPRDKFISIDQDTFNKKGFLVVQNEEWSGIGLYRVPTEGILKDNEKGTDIVAAIRYGCGMMGMPISGQGLHEEQAPIKIDIKQAKKGDNSFMYVPAAPVEKGFYLIDYKLNGQGHLGYNPIVID
jgi:hypothetical protein